MTRTALLRLLAQFDQQIEEARALASHPDRGGVGVLPRQRRVLLATLKEAFKRNRQKFTRGEGGKWQLARAAGGTVE